MDKVAFYEEVILGEVFEKEAKEKKTRLPYGSVVGENGEVIYVPSDEDAKKGKRNLLVGSLVGAAGGAGTGIVARKAFPTYHFASSIDTKHGRPGPVSQSTTYPSKLSSGLIGAGVGAAYGALGAHLANNIKNKERTTAIIDYYEKLQNEDPDAWK